MQFVVREELLAHAEEREAAADKARGARALPAAPVVVAVYNIVLLCVAPRVTHASRRSPCPRGSMRALAAFIQRRSALTRRASCRWPSRLTLVVPRGPAPAPRACRHRHLQGALAGARRGGQRVAARSRRVRVPRAQGAGEADAAEARALRCDAHPLRFPDARRAAHGRRPRTNRRAVGAPPEINAVITRAVARPCELMAWTGQVVVHNACIGGNATRAKTHTATTHGSTVGTPRLIISRAVPRAPQQGYPLPQCWWLQAHRAHCTHAAGPVCRARVGAP